MSTSARHVIFGTGAIGLSTLEALRRRGETVRLVNRSGTAPVPDDVEIVRGDASDPGFTTAAAHGVRATPVLLLRVMWGTMHRIVGGLDPFPPTRSGLDILIDSFGQLLLAHVQRDDVVGQAVSWARAEQTGYWQEGDRSSAEPCLDLDQIDELLRTIKEHNAAWKTWVQQQGVEPYFVRYEDLIADPRNALQGLLDRLGVELPSDWRPESPHRRQADEVNAEWVRRYRSARAPSSGPGCEIL